MMKQAIQRAISTKPKWDRSKYIGASEIGGCSLKIYYDKTDDDGFRGNGRTERGNVLESAIISLMKKGGIDIRYHDDGRINRQREIEHPDYPVRVHPDGIIYEAFQRPHVVNKKRMVTDYKEVAVLEIKTVGTDRFRILDEPDAPWVLQTRFNAFMAEVPKGVLVAVDASDLENVKEWEFEAMPETEATHLLEKAKRIMTAVEIGIEPFAEPSSERCKWCSWKDRCEKRWVPDAEAKDNEIEAQELAPAMKTMARAKDMMAEAKEMERGARAAILNVAKERNAAKLSAGGFLVVVEARKGRASIDTKRMLAEHPEIDSAKYEKHGAASVALKIKEI